MTNSDHELTIAELKDTIAKLEVALQEQKEAEVGLRVRAASAEGCLRVTTANSQARIKELEAVLEERSGQLQRTNATLESTRRDAKEAQEDALGRDRAKEETIASLKSSLLLTSDERDALRDSLERHELEAQRAKEESAAKMRVLERDLAEELAKNTELGRANADLSRRLLEEAAEMQKVKAELCTVTDLTERRWAALQTSREEIVKLEAARSLMREQLMAQIDEGESRFETAAHRADQLASELASLQLVSQHLEKQCAGLKQELHNEVTSKNLLRWDAEASTGLLRGQLYDVQGELDDVVSVVLRQQEDQVMRARSLSADLQHVHKRLRDCEAERETLREQLVDKQVALQNRCEREHDAMLKASAVEGQLRVAAQSAQSRVHQVEAMNAALRQMLSDLTTESRAVIQDLYSALLLCSEIDIESEQRRTLHTEAVLRSEIQLLNDELEGTRMSLEDHAVNRCRLEFEAGEAQNQAVHLRNEQARLLEEQLRTGEQRTMAHMQPRLAELKANIHQLQDELWHCSRDVAIGDQERRHLQAEVDALQKQLAAANARLKHVHEDALKAELLPKVELLRQQMEATAHTIHLAAGDCRIELQETAVLRERVAAATALLRDLHRVAQLDVTLTKQLDHSIAQQLEDLTIKASKVSVNHRPTSVPVLYGSDPASSYQVRMHSQQPPTQQPAHYSPKSHKWVAESSAGIADQTSTYLLQQPPQATDPLVSFPQKQHDGLANDSGRNSLWVQGLTDFGAIGELALNLVAPPAGNARSRQGQKGAEPATKKFYDSKTHTWMTVASVEDAVAEGKGGPLGHTLQSCDANDNDQVGTNPRPDTVSDVDSAPSPTPMHSRLDLQAQYLLHGFSRDGVPLGLKRERLSLAQRIDAEMEERKKNRWWAGDKFSIDLEDNLILDPIYAESSLAHSRGRPVSVSAVSALDAWRERERVRQREAKYGDVGKHSSTSSLRDKAGRRSLDLGSSLRSVPVQTPPLEFPPPRRYVASSYAS
jgi:chromosome segregation ATPase